MLPAARTLTVLATIAISVSCQTLNDPFPPQASLNFGVTDSMVGSQLAPLPSPQVASFRVEDLSASDISGFDGPHSFLYSGPCSYQLNALAPVSFDAACRTSGLTLAPGTDLQNATLRMTISRLELRAAARPDLSSSADPDGDGVPNSSDNCPIVHNPDQANLNENQESFKIGDACSYVDTEGNRTIPDQDLDGVADGIDNCFWYPNPLAFGETTPPDSDRDGIGDACERIAPVVLLDARLTVECKILVELKTAPAKITFFIMDFGRPGVLTCDAGFTGCTIDPSALKLSLAGASTTIDCRQVEQLP